MTRGFDVLIVGGGHGGAQAATALRRERFVGSIAIVGDEPELPYDRPPLSKEYLAGEKAWDRLPFRTAEAWGALDVELVLGHAVVSVDGVAHCVVLSNGEVIGYGQMIWATGGAPRQLHCGGHDLVGVHTVRNRADVDRMIAEMPSVRHALVIGGGYIGLEAAAVLAKLGKHVTLLEVLDRVLARVAAAPLSRFYEAEHRAHGVDLHLDIAVDHIVADGSKAVGVRLVDGTLLAADMVVVGIGIVPAVAPLLAARADGGNGVRVDPQMRTSLPDVFAVGDCAEHRNVHAEGDWIRVESVQNANDQATIAAKTITGGTDVYASVPWFWSNQYDLKLQTVGLSRGYDDVVIRGDPVARSFSVVYLRDGAVIALDCVNAVRDYSPGKAIVTARLKVGIDALADISKPLKRFV